MASTLQNVAGLADDETDSTPQAAQTDDDLMTQAAGVPALRRVYQRAIDNLKAERVGPSGNEKWWALAAALAKPVVPGQGRFGQVLGNVGETMSAYSAAKAKAEKEKRDLLAKYELGLGTSEATLAAAQMRANKPQNLTPTDEARFRMGIARQLYPGKTPQQIIDENLMYSPDVNREALSYVGMRSAAMAGEPVAAAAPRVPTLEQFMAAARASPKNSGVSDDELRAYYNKTYGGR